MVQSVLVSVSELFHRLGEYLSYLFVHVPRLATEAGLGSWQVAAVALLVGLALLLIGVRLGPLLSGVAGGAVGWFVATRYPALGAAWGLPAGAAVWVLTLVAGLACAFAPVLYPILLGALPGAAWGAGVPVMGKAWLGVVGGALVLGAVCFAARRIVLALTAAIPGVFLIDAAILVLALRFPALTAVTKRPTLFAALTAILLVAGTAAQVSTQPSGGHRPGELESTRKRGKRPQRTSDED